MNLRDLGADPESGPPPPQNPQSLEIFVGLLWLLQYWVLEHNTHAPILIPAPKFSNPEDQLS